MLRVTYVRYVLAGLFCCSLVACASTGTMREFESTATYPGASFGEVWDSVIDIFGDRLWAIDNMERDSGIITTDWMLDTNVSYQDCGSAGTFGSDNNHMGRFNIVVREQPTGTSMRVTTTWRVTRNSDLDSSSSLVDCFSTGVLEREIHE